MATLYITEFSRTTVTGVTDPATQIATPSPWLRRRLPSTPSAPP
jgi:hypothetical protein